MNEPGNDIGTDTRLEFRDVTKRFQDRQGSGQTITAVEGVSLSLRDGEVVSLIGVAVGEFAGGNSGVGYLIVPTAGSAETPKVFAAIFVLTMIGIFAYWLVIFVESRVLHYMPSREHRGF
jgi:hypothetical protein